MPMERQSIATPGKLNPAISSKSFLVSAKQGRNSSGSLRKGPIVINPLTRMFSRVATASQQMLINARRALESARKLRLQTQKFLQETEFKSRHQKQPPILRVHLPTGQEVGALIREANEEIHRTRIDIRFIRIAARDELAAQDRLADAAKLRSFTASLQRQGLETASQASVNR